MLLQDKRSAGVEAEQDVVEVAESPKAKDVVNDIVNSLISVYRNDSASSNEHLFHN
jgi:hypothetical protein